jgi:hypothetical protein
MNMFLRYINKDQRYMTMFLRYINKDQRYMTMFLRYINKDQRYMTMFLRYMNKDQRYMTMFLRYINKDQRYMTMFLRYMNKDRYNFCIYGRKEFGCQRTDEPKAVVAVTKAVTNIYKKNNMLHNFILHGKYTMENTTWSKLQAAGAHGRRTYRKADSNALSLAANVGGNL